MSLPLRDHAQGITVPIRVKPRAKRNQVTRMAEGLRVEVTAPPVEGQANAAVCALLAESLGLRKRQVEILQGESAREKVVLIRECSREDLLVKLLALCVTCLILLGCGPKPPETMLDGYINALLLAQDRQAALNFVQYPAGVEPPPDVGYCYKDEALFYEIATTYFTKKGATNEQERKRVWRELKREGRVQIRRAHTSSTTATVEIDIEPNVGEEAGLEKPVTHSWYFVLLRGTDQIWKLNRVEAQSDTQSREFHVDAYERVNKESRENAPEE